MEFAGSKFKPVEQNMYLDQRSSFPRNCNNKRTERGDCFRSSGQSSETNVDEERTILSQ